MFSCTSGGYPNVSGATCLRRGLCADYVPAFLHLACLSWSQRLFVGFEGRLRNWWTEEQEEEGVGIRCRWCQDYD